MRTLFVDSEFKVYVNDGEGRTAIETDAFDGLCDELIECHRYVPQGKSFTKDNGITVYGIFIQPYKDTAEAEIAQIHFSYQNVIAEYESELADADAALAELSVEWGEDNG